MVLICLGVNYTTFKETFLFNFLCLLPLQLIHWHYLVERRVVDAYTGEPNDDKKNMFTNKFVTSVAICAFATLCHYVK